jgi:hypothetical protein
MRSFDEVLGALYAAQTALVNTLAKLEIRALDEDCDDEERRLIELEVDKLTFDKEDLASRIGAMIATQQRFEPPPPEVVQGLEKATETLAKQVAKEAASSELIDLAISLGNAARKVKKPGE